MNNDTEIKSTMRAAWQESNDDPDFYMYCADWVRSMVYGAGLGGAAGKMLFPIWGPLALSMGANQAWLKSAYTVPAFIGAVLGPIIGKKLIKSFYSAASSDNSEAETIHADNSPLEKENSVKQTASTDIGYRYS